MSEVDPRSEDQPPMDEDELVKQTDGAATEDTSQDVTLDEIELLREKLDTVDQGPGDVPVK